MDAEAILIIVGILAAVPFICMAAAPDASEFREWEKEQ